MGSGGLGRTEEQGREVGPSREFYGFLWDGVPFSTAQPLNASLPQEAFLHWILGKGPWSHIQRSKPCSYSQTPGRPEWPRNEDPTAHLETGSRSASLYCTVEAPEGQRTEVSALPDQELEVLGGSHGCRWSKEGCSLRQERTVGWDRFGLVHFLTLDKSRILSGLSLPQLQN